MNDVPAHLQRLQDAATRATAELRDDPAGFRFQRDQAHETIRELLTLLDRYTEAGGVMWCIVHDGVADETNRGDICDMSDEDTSCQLVRLYYKAQS